MTSPWAGSTRIFLGRAHLARCSGTSAEARAPKFGVRPAYLTDRRPAAAEPHEYAHLTLGDEARSLIDPDPAWQTLEAGLHLCTFDLGWPGKGMDSSYRVFDRHGDLDRDPVSRHRCKRLVWQALDTVAPTRRRGQAGDLRAA